MAVKMSIVYFASIYLNLIALSASEVVPVLTWGNIKTNAIPSIPAGHSLPREDFGSLLESLSQQPNQNFLVFLQNKLSLDDITQNADVYSTNSDGAAYHNLKNLMQTHSSTHLPRVTSPLEAIDEWKDKFSGKVHDLTSPFRVRDLPLSEDASNLVVVHLPDRASRHTEEATSLRNIDNVIGSVSSEIESLNKPYTALYTAAAPSKVKTQALYFGRHLLAETADSPKPHFYEVKPCIFFYAEKMVFEIKGAEKGKNASWELPPTTNTQGSTCDGEYPKLVLVFPAVGTLTSLTMTIEFGNTSTGYWLMQGWNVTYQTSINYDGKDAPMSLVNSETPYKFSYHCTNAVYVEAYNGTSSGKTVAKASVNAINLQFQAFEIEKGQFGFANDCVGFFTIPIWSGIFTTLLLIVILAFGIMMLANINTMDRFDDPKGKTISVNVAE